LACGGEETFPGQAAAREQDAQIGFTTCRDICPLGAVSCPPVGVQRREALDAQSRHQLRD